MAVGALDIERIFFQSPFRSEPLLFRAVADGAITLAGINTVVGVSSRTVGLLAVDVADGGAVEKDILSDGDGLEVLWVHASPITTKMIDHATFRQITVSGEPCDTMCPAVLAAKKEHAIPVFVQLALPQ